MMIFVLSVVFLAAGSVRAGFTNGSFETGDLTGWTVVVPSGASVSVVASHADPMTNVGGDGPIVYGTTSWGPTDGSAFALLKTDGPGSITQLYQSFYATAGADLTFDYFWDSQDYAPFDDTGTGTPILVLTPLALVVVLILVISMVLPGRQSAIHSRPRECIHC